MCYQFLQNILTTLIIVVSNQSSVIIKIQDTFSSEVLSNRDEFQDFKISEDSILNLRREGGMTVEQNKEKEFTNTFYQYKTDDYELETNNKEDESKKTHNYIILQKRKRNLNPKNESSKWHANFPVVMQYNPTSKPEGKINHPRKNYILIKRKRKTKRFDGSRNLDNIINYHEKIGIPQAIHIRRVESRRISYSKIVEETRVSIEQFPYAVSHIFSLILLVATSRRNWCFYYYTTNNMAYHIVLTPRVK